MTIGNPAFCFSLFLTCVYFGDELQHVGDVSEQKTKSRPIRIGEIGGIRLSEELHATVYFFFTFNILLLQLFLINQHLAD